MCYQTPFPGPNGINFGMYGKTDHQSVKGYVPRDCSNDTCHSCGKIVHHSWENICPNVDCTLNKKGSEQTNTDKTNTKDKEDKDQKWNDFDSEDYEGTGFFQGSIDPLEDVSGRIFGQNGMLISFNQHRFQVLPEGAVGLDSMSTVDIFGNKVFLNNSRKVKSSIRIMCNTGTVTVNNMGNLEGYGSVWYHPKAIANIFSL